MLKLVNYLLWVLTINKANLYYFRNSIPKMEPTITFQIAKYLSIQDIGNLFQVCKQTYRIINSGLLYKFLTYRDFSFCFDDWDLPNDDNYSWKCLYQKLYHTKLYFLHCQRIHHYLISVEEYNEYEYSLEYMIRDEFSGYSINKNEYYIETVDDIEQDNYINLDYRGRSWDIFDEDFIEKVGYEYCLTTKMLNDPRIKGNRYQFGKYIFIYDGLCYFNDNTKFYEVLLPMECIENLFDKCDEQIMRENYWPEKLSNYNKYMKQITLIIYKANKKFYKIPNDLDSKFDDCNLTLFEHTFLDTTLTCRFLRCFKNRRYYIENCIVPGCCGHAFASRYCNPHENSKFLNTKLYNKKWLDNFYEECENLIKDPEDSPSVFKLNCKLENGKYEIITFVKDESRTEILNDCPFNDRELFTTF